MSSGAADFLCCVGSGCLQDCIRGIMRINHSCNRFNAHSAIFIFIYFSPFLALLSYTIKPLRGSDMP